MLLNANKPANLQSEAHMAPIISRIWSGRPICRPPTANCPHGDGCGGRNLSPSGLAGGELAPGPRFIEPTGPLADRIIFIQVPVGGN